MKILFVGAVKFSAHALHELIAMQANIVGICTLDKSTFNADHANLTQIAHDAGIPVRNTPNINDPETVDWVYRLNPDVIFCFGWSQLIGTSLLALPRLGVIGFHPAALPENRGRHPLIWALVLGLPETASTFFFMDAGADTGDILSQVILSIEPSDNARSLYARITNVAMEQIRDFVPRLANDSVQRYPQDHSRANVWRKRSVADGRIDWRMSAESIHNLVRGLTTPYIGASFEYQRENITVWHSAIEHDIAKNLEPGKVLTVDSRGILVKAGTGGVRLLDIEPQVTLYAGDYL